MARLIFDLDGTLVDSAPTLAATANAMLVHMGRDPVPLATVIGFVGHGVRRLVEQLLNHTGGIPAEGIDPYFAKFREIYDADPVTGTTLYPGVGSSLAALAEQGHGLAVCTQKSNVPALMILKALDLMPPLTGFTGGDSTAVLKPDPRMFRHAADQLPPGPAVMIGDSMTDARTAEAAGVPFLLHTRGYRHEPIETIPHAAAFDDFAELPDLITQVLTPA